MNIQPVKIADLKPHPMNYNTHPEAQLLELEKSLETFQQFKNIVVCKGVILAGHGLVEAAKRRGIKELDAVVMNGLTEEQQKALLVADNALPFLAVPDVDMLQALIDELGDFEIPGVNEDWMSQFEFPDPAFDLDTDDRDLDAVPDVVEPLTQPGDLWQLGKHRLLCGDSTKREDVARLMNRQKADMVFTDPPYGIKRDEGFEGFEGFGGFGKPISRKQYKGGWDEERPPKACFDILVSLSDTVLIFGGNYFADLLPQGKHWIVWDKKNTMPTFGDCELVWTNVKRDSVKIKVFEYNGLIGKEKGERVHATQKPIALIQDLFETYGKDKTCIVDLFGGSGSTLIACEQTGRTCYMMELDPHYCDVIVARWETFTGETAVKEC